jgi:glyceraldehyde 3-phosphate dehydrogenase
MKTRVAINGFGRIGRTVLRSILEENRNEVEVVAINGTASVETLAHLLKYDSVHGRFRGDVSVENDSIDAGRGPMKVTAIRDPSTLSWGEMGIDIVFECTGAFNDRDKAAAHLSSGAKRVLISAPVYSADLTVVYGVNHGDMTARHEIVSSASCTTNCLAPLAKVLHENVGIEQGFMTTIHSYTTDQRLLDNTHKDLYRARSAATNIIPTATGAAKALGMVLPELEGKLDGIAMRVPTSNVSVVDLKFMPQRQTSIDEINGIMKKASTGVFKGIIGYTDEKLVSSDFVHDPHSSIFHADQTKVMEGGLCRVMSWYDNEWGFSCRMVDTAVAMGKLLRG